VVESEKHDVTLNPERQEVARRYARQNRQLLVVDLGISAALVLAFLLSGASRLLEALLVGWGLSSPWILVAAYIGLVFVAYTLLLMPLSYYSGFVLPHRYGLSTQTLSGWLTDEAKSFGLGVVLGLPVAEVVYWLLRTYPDTWWLWASAFLLVLNVIVGYLAPVLLLPLFYKLTPLDNPDLAERIRRLAERAGARIVGVYSIDMSRRTTAANAMIIGLGNTRRIALGDTLRGDYPPEEVESIVAHELGHQVHHDLELQVILSVVTLTASLYLAHLFLRWGVALFGFQGPGDVAALPLVLIATGLFSLVIMPVTNGYSRWRESMADRYAIRVTGNATAFAQAMVRLANQNLSDANPPRWVVWLLYSHPPIAERVRQAELTVYSQG